MGVGLTERVAGAILAGGRAARFGGVPKGLLEVGGVRIVDRIAAALRPVTDEILIVSEAPDAGAWLPDARVVGDVLRGGASAAGVHAALRAAAGAVIVVAWDLPFVTTPLFATLLEHRRDARTGLLHDAVAPERAGNAGGAERLEPLCAWYAPACADAIERQWDSGDRSLHGLLRRVKTAIVSPLTLAPMGGAERLFFNVNTPGDLDAARAFALPR